MPGPAPAAADGQRRRAYAMKHETKQTGALSMQEKLLLDRTKCTDKKKGVVVAVGVTVILRPHVSSSAIDADPRRIATWKPDGNGGKDQQRESLERCQKDFRRQTLAKNDVGGKKRLQRGCLMYKVIFPGVVWANLVACARCTVRAFCGLH